MMLSRTVSVDSGLRENAHSRNGLHDGRFPIPEKHMNRLVELALLCLVLVPFASAETRSAQDMARECWVALDLFQDRVEKSFENTLFAGECIGYIQGAGDFSLAMADNVKWFKVCVPDSTSTMILIHKFIAFVD
jgi:hypothetical protein